MQLIHGRLQYACVQFMKPVSTNNYDFQHPDLLSFTGYESPTEEEQLRAIWNEVNVGATGFLDKNELSVVCDHIGMDTMNEQVCDVIKLLS